jgi:hypothetical protein
MATYPAMIAGLFIVIMNMQARGTKVVAQHHYIKVTVYSTKPPPRIQAGNGNFQYA